MTHDSPLMTHLDSPLSLPLFAFILSPAHGELCEQRTRRFGAPKTA